MAEVRCPMCSKLNPADAEVCRYCQARLKPLMAPPGNSSGGGEPDWFSELNSNAPKGSKPSGQAQEPTPGGEPDWLSKIRDRARSETSEPDVSDLFREAQGSEGGEADWMSGVQESGGSAEQGEGAGEDWLSRLGSAPSAPASEPAGDQKDELSSWLSGIQQETSAPEPSQESPAPSSEWSGLGDFSFEETAAPAASNQEEDDWMKNLSSWQTGFQESSPAEAETPQEVQGQDQGWGMQFQQPETPAPSGADDTLDWLRGFDTSQPVEQAPAEQPDFSFGDALSQPETEAGAESAAPGDVPDWLKSFDTSQNAPVQEPAQETTDWSTFGDFGQQPAPAQEEPETTPSPAGQDEGLPDWLTGMGAAAGLGAAAAQQEEPEAQGQEFPWMQSGTETPQTPAAGEQAESELPDWLSAGFAAPETPSAGAEEPGAPVPAEEAGLPDWFTAGREAPVEPAVPSETAETPAGEVGLPDWFSGFGAEEEAAPAEAQPQAEPTSGVPDWMSAFEAQQAGPEVETGEAVESTQQEPFAAAPTGQDSGGAALPFTEDSLPDWLGEFKGQEAPPPVPAFTGMDDVPAVNNKPFDVDLPDWLNEETAPAVEGQPGAPVEEAGAMDQLAQADLPSWVQAMRPVETAMSGEPGMEEGDQRVEKAGPLAGMRGVLPAEESVVQYRKPPTYAFKLRVSEKQHAQMSLLDGVLARETQPKAVAQAASQSPLLIQRIIVALVLLILLTGMVMFNVQIFGVPGLVPQEIVSMHKQVDSLQAGDTILVAIDYEPAFSGEMRFTAIQLIDQLMKQQVPITVVSTVPTGPALADDLIRSINQQNEDYNLDKNVENLGYLPGGTISLLEFARNPRRSAPRNTSGEDVWANSPVLAGIDNIQDFKRVIVLTDRAEVGRAWVEQVQPLLGDVPLLMVSSAQAGPMLEPYVNSGQVQGMISGLLGGTLYGQWAGQNDPNTAPLRYWGAYQSGLLLAFILVLVGSLFSIAAGSMKPKQKGKA